MSITDNRASPVTSDSLVTPPSEDPLAKSCWLTLHSHRTIHVLDPSLSARASRLRKKRRAGDVCEVFHQDGNFSSITHSLPWAPLLLFLHTPYREERKAPAAPDSCADRHTRTQKQAKHTHTHTQRCIPVLSKDSAVSVTSLAAEAE